MGWDSCTLWTNKAIVIGELLSSMHKSRWEVLGYKSTSQAAYFAVKTDKGDQFIYVALLERRNGYYAMKTMSENMGPAVCDCPLNLLDLVPCSGERYAVEWRERVRKYHEAIGRDIPLNAVVELYGKQYRYIGQMPGKRTDTMVCLKTGLKYRIKKSQLADLKVIS